eukprot:jgi/Psemu1/293284/fgenesh1_pg.2000_\
MFFEKRHPEWDLTGHTVSEEQHRFVETKLPKHNFRVNLRSYDELDDDDDAGVDSSTSYYDVIYSIEALIHSTNITHTLKQWVDHLKPGGIIVIIDDYVSENAYANTADANANANANTDADTKHDDPDLMAFSKSWLANVLITPTEFGELAASTGSTASGMARVTSKFQHFAGPLQYWKLDSDPAAQHLERTLSCDIDDCPSAETCAFDVTFSHTVLEHAKRPWKSFQTIARITKRGGLTMHLVPWSYQYHATPDDHYRFSHKALTLLLEDNGFDVLEVGYDICSKPEAVMKERVDEHYDVVWLTYVVGRKR